MQDSPRIPNASPFRIHTPVLNSPVFESTTYEAEEEQAFVCEGPLADFPIMDDRTSGLAVECWNLRKTILDLNSKSIQLQRDLKTHKNLVRSQKKLVNDVTEENRTRLRESTSLKIKISELEKKLQESNKANDALSTNVERYKKVISNMTTKHNAADREKKEQLAHREALIKKIEEEHTTLRTTQQTRLSALEAEQARLVIENSSLKQLLRDSTGKAQELMEHTDKLAAALEKVNAQNKNSSDLLNKELEDAYEGLNRRLEQVWEERVETARQLHYQEQENQQLLGFILSEGLELPDFPRPPSPPPMGACR